MATVPYTDPAIAPTSFDVARRDDFFGFGNAMQAIDSVTPKYRNSDGTLQQPTQIVTVHNGSLVPDMAFALSGGTFFDLRPPSEIFAEMDSRLNQQRQHVLDSPQMLRMLEQR
jgi:hypothetical protein